MGIETLQVLCCVLVVNIGYLLVMIGADYSYVMGNMVQVAGRMIIVQQIPPPHVSHVY